MDKSNGSKLPGMMFDRVSEKVRKFSSELLARRIQIWFWFGYGFFSYMEQKEVQIGEGGMLSERLGHTCGIYSLEPNYSWERFGQTENCGLCSGWVGLGWTGTHCFGFIVD